MNLKKQILCLIVVSGCIHTCCLFASPQKTGFFFDLLWSGSWERGKNVINRIDLKLGVPGPGLIFRGQLVDRRPGPSSDSATPPLTVLGAGLYHTGTGSRILYGNIDEIGLAARLKNVWTRGPPLQMNHSLSAGDLATAPLGTKQPGLFLYLGSPRWGPVRVFSSVYVEHDLDQLYITGMDYYFSEKTWLKIEGLYTEQMLDARIPASWFSEQPWLPERTSRLYGGSINFNHTFWGISGDAAYSETFAFGTGWYGGVSFRLGNKPWRFQAGGDMIRGAFVDRGGKDPDEGIRIGAQFEAWEKAGSYFKINGSVQGPGSGEHLSKSKILVSYYFSVPKQVVVWPSRISFSVERNISDSSDPESTAKAGLGLYLGPVLATSGFSIHGNNDDNRKALPWVTDFTDFTEWTELSFSEELQYRIKAWTFRVKFAYLIEEKKTGKVGSYNFQVYSSIYGKWGRLSGTLNFDKFPDIWTYTVSWQLKHTFQFENNQKPCGKQRGMLVL